jgi:hypothetical protein
MTTGDKTAGVMLRAAKNARVLSRVFINRSPVPPPREAFRERSINLELLA